MTPRALALCLLLTACGGRPPPATEALWTPRPLAATPHDPTAFTQGLLLLPGGRWVESTGGYGTSRLREVDRDTGRILREHLLSRHYFGEGVALHENRYYQLTWREKVCIVYDANDWTELRRFRCSEEGWGITSDHRKLYTSDGSDTIRVRDPETFAVERSFRVRGGRGPVTRLNELEWVNGELWANVWQSTWIVRVDPVNGQVKGWVDLSAFPPVGHRTPTMDVLNGIALDPESGHVWITGKNWSYCYDLGVPPPTSR